MNPPTTPSEAARAELIGLLYRFPLRIITHVANAALVVVVLWGVLPHDLLFIWFGAVSVVALVRYALARRFVRLQPGRETIGARARHFVVGAAVSGALWGATTLIIWLTPEITYHVFAAFVIAGISAATVATSYSHPPAVYAFILTAVGPLSLGYLVQGGTLHLAMGAMCLLYLIFLTIHTRFSYAVLLESLRLGEENTGLIADLSGARDALEQRVKERTAELETINAALQEEMTAHAETQRRLQQAHRMEAIGQLTGGIAHDFNNLLAVMLGNAELLRTSQSKQGELIDSIIRAGKRGAELTRRLLAFSRRQPLRPKAIKISDLIAEMTPLLRRSLGQSIRVETETEAGLWVAAADPGQVENAILNLALNARDAMPKGGTLTISGHNARVESRDLTDALDTEPGDYVLIAVGDTGHGMTEEVRDRAFEPFFTTKDVGEGSGLGLSMVYGFAKQSGGHLMIESAEDGGTRIDLYLPRAQPAIDAEAPPLEGKLSDSDDDDTPPCGRGESVLVVEDDPEVRAFAVKALSRLGYRVQQAGDAAEAEAELERHQFELLLCDVVLPGGRSGPDFAAAAKRRRPDLHVVFMSGFSEQGPAQTLGVPQDGNAVLLHKPFEIGVLARALRDALDAAPPADDAAAAGLTR